MSFPLDDFAHNLRLLSSHHRSVADLCRRMKFNRQQFNRYLAGSYLPTARNLRRLADFFGVEETELFLPHIEFTRSVIAKPRSVAIPPGLQEFWRSRLPSFTSSQALLSDYVGLYHLHFRSPAWPKSIIRSLAAIGQKDGTTYIRNIERLVRKEKSPLSRFIMKYSGIILPMGDRLYCFDSADDGDHGISLMIFYPNHRRKIVFLHGMLLGVTAGSGRQIYSSRAVMAKLSPNMDSRAALERCGIFPSNSRAIDGEILDAVANEVDSRSGALLALEL